MSDFKPHHWAPKSSIEAVELTVVNIMAVMDWIGKSGFHVAPYAPFLVWMDCRARFGDYIVKDPIRGDFYVLESAAFRRMFVESD
jgi:hypothetical protein